MKIYLCAPYPTRQGVIQPIENILKLNGHICTSRWVSSVVEPNQPTDEEWSQIAIEDLKDVDDADVLFCVNDEEWANKGTGGRHVELGYALAKRKPILLIGARTNAFHYHPGVTYLENRGDYIKALKRMEAK